MKYLLALAALSLLLTGCNSDPLLGQPRPKETEKVNEKPKLENTFNNPKLDLLFVVDDSGSMGSHQINLSNNIDQFVTSIFANKLIDYNIGVITSTKENNGALRGGFITKQTPSKELILKTNLLAGTGGSGTEHFFEPIKAALESSIAGGINKGFYRPDAFLAIVFITDTGPSDRLMNSGQLFNYLVRLKSGDVNRVLSYGAIIPMENPNNCPTDGEWRGAVGELFNFINLTKGSYFDLCSPTFGRDLARIGEDLVERITFVIPLDQVPVVSTIEVKYGTQLIPQDPNKGWTYDPEQIALRFGRELELEDQPGVTELTVSFKPAKEIRN